MKKSEMYKRFWFDRTEVLTLPSYVKLMVSVTKYIRGEKLIHEEGKVFKVRSHTGAGRTLILEGVPGWQRYSYSLFIPATESEYFANIKTKPDGHD